LEWAPWGGQSGELELTVEPGFRKKEAHGQAPHADVHRDWLAFTNDRFLHYDTPSYSPRRDISCNADVMRMIPVFVSGSKFRS
jgi:hypothetical protein